MDETEFWQNVKNNLENGQIRLLFVADKIPIELKTIIEFLNKQMDKTEVLAVEITQYAADEEKNRTLVSRIFGQTIEAQTKKGSGLSLSKIDEEKFFENLDQFGKNFFKSLFKFADEKGLIINWGTKGFSLNVEIDGKKVSLLEGYSNLRSNGQIVNSTGGISRKVENGDKIVANYVNKVTEIKDFVKTSIVGYKFHLNRNLNEDEWEKFKSILSEQLIK